MKQLSIVFLTGADKSWLLESILRSQDKIIGVILPFSSKREDRLKSVIQIAQDNAIPIFRPTKSELKKVLKDLEPDILLSAGYPYILKQECLDIATYNINVHPTLLPHYRGPSTAWHVIAHGEMESGVTIYLIDEGMDTGPIIAQKRVSLTKFDTVRSLMIKTNEIEPSSVLAALDILRSGDIKAIPQDESVASMFKEIRTPEDSRIDPNKSLTELYNFIRACDPDRFPAFFEVDGQKVGIRLFRLNRPEDESETI